MTRIAEALKRAAGGVADRQAAGPTADAIPFSSSDQPAVLSPWTLGANEPRPPNTAYEPQVHSHAAETARRPAAARAEKLVTASGFPFVAREQYNRLGTVLRQAQLERSIKVVMLTSARPAEGKTLTAANLALTLSESHRRRVLLVDADLRQPSLHEVFGVAVAPGLSDSLDAGGSVPVIQLNARLSLLTAGNSGGDPIETLTSHRMRTFIDDSRRTFDWVLIDTPPVGLLTDARLLASMTDAALLVAMAGKTPYDAIQSAVQALGAECLAGVVLNGVVDGVLPHSVYRDYYEGRRT
jgi:receptor protein-tyrosine kinase